ncbi:hypothetical protein, partial [Vibrio sinaloensis]|uniref:hypothetical protein n=1 Tax=Photobacterium sp. (strain ATCC 43367) TaxID=379097 RepID=UPI002F4031EE
MVISYHLCPKRHHSIQNYKKTLYSLSEFAMIRSALESCVGKTKLKYKNTLEGFPSGQRDQTVNLLALP